MAGLRDIVHILNEEVRQIPNGIVTLWHSEITLNMLRFKDLRVVEIVASSANEAKAKLNKILNNEKK